MNNLEEWEEAGKTLKNAMKNWNPHFEALRAENEENEPILVLFMLKDTTKEWELYNNAPEWILEDLAGCVEDAKEELLEKVKFDMGQFEDMPITEAMADEMSRLLDAKMREHEKRDGRKLAELFYNMVMYSEWVVLPEDVLEKRYEEHMEQEDY